MKYSGIFSTINLDCLSRNKDFYCGDTSVPVGRQKEFSPDEAIKKAMRLFWERGYEGTSMAELLDRLSISRSSFYDTFGDKKTIFLKSMDHFTNLMMGAIQGMTLYSDPRHPLDMVYKHFALSRVLQFDNDVYNTCYISATTLEMAMNEVEVRHRSEVFFKLYKDAFKFTIEKGMELGQLEVRDTDRLAWFLVNSISGLGIMRRAGLPIEKIDGIILETLAPLGSESKARYYYWIGQLKDMNNPLTD